MSKTSWRTARGDSGSAPTGGGLNLFDRATNTFAHYRHDPSDETSLSSDVVRTVYEDSKGDLWMGTFTGGISFYNKNNTAFSYFRHQPNDPNSLSHSSGLSFFEDEEGILWIGTEAGLNRYDRKTQRFRSYQHDPRDPKSLSANAVISILKDSRGNFWVGTYFGGLNLFDEQHGTFEHFLPDASDPKSLSNPHVWDILEDSQGQLWLATFGGVNRYDYATGDFIRYQHNPDDERSIGNNIVWYLYEDRSGTMWVGTNGGLSRYDRSQDRFHTYRHDEQDSTSLSNDEVSTLFEDRQGQFWVGTNGGGLNVFDRQTETFRVFRTSDGLSNDVVQSIGEDDQGHLWLGTKEGISKFDPRRETFTNYDKSDGLLAESFKHNATLRSQDGQLFFGGSNGFTSFHPNSVRDNPYPPPIVLTDFQVFNKPVALGEHDSPLQKHITQADRIQLRYDQMVISFSFAALNYRSPEKNQYAYIMQGFDKEWQYAGTKRTATYTNLDPGNYIFHVKGANNSGVWNEKGVAIEIAISPPFWVTWWFRGVLIFLIVGGLMGAYRRRVQAFERRHQALEIQVADRTKALDESNEALNVTNDVLEKTNQQLEAKNDELERFAYTVSHDLKSPLVTIRGFLGLLEKDIAADDQKRIQTDFAQIINATDKMQLLLNELLRLFRAGRSAHASENVSLSSLADEAVALVSGQIAERGVEVVILSELPVVLGDRVRLTEVFQNLIANAVKYMGDQTHPRIEIGARSAEAEVVCFVRDNGMGIEPRYHEKVFGLFERLDAGIEGSGVGLALVKRIIEVHGGRVWVESAGEGQGSTFYFTLPSSLDPP